MIAHYKIYKTTLNEFIYIKFKQKIVFFEIPYIKIESKLLYFYLPPYRYFICRPTKYLIYNIPRNINTKKNKIKILNNLNEYKYLIILEKNIKINEKIKLIKKC